MKLKKLTIICLIFGLYLGSGGLLGAFELEITGGVDLLTFNPSMETAHSDAAAESLEFKPFPFILGNIKFKNDISNNLAYIINFNRDNIIRNNLEFKLAAKTDYFNFEFGPFAGMPDALEIPSVGITGGLEFMFPGVVFIGVNASSTIGSQLDSLSNNTRETAEAKAGFWLPFMIATFSASTQNFTHHSDSGLTTRDNLIKYQASFDFYSKKNPSTFRLDAGYKTLNRFYTYSASSSGDPDDGNGNGNGDGNGDGDPDPVPPGPDIPDSNVRANTTDTLNALYAGFELRIQTRGNVKFIIGAELPVFFIDSDHITFPLFFNMTRAFIGIGIGRK